MVSGPLVGPCALDSCVVVPVVPRHPTAVGAGRLNRLRCPFKGVGRAAFWPCWGLCIKSQLRQRKLSYFFGK